MTDDLDHQGRPGGTGDAGVIAVTTALMAVILIVAVAFALDTGRWYVEGLRLQRTVDAAALAGAPYLPGDLATARAEARKLIETNGYDAATVPDSDILVADRPSRLRVTMSNTIPNLFAAVIGINTQTLTRTATADFAAPATLANSCNALGHDPQGCPPDPEVRGSIAGPDTYKESGDRYATRSCENSSSSNCDAMGRNLDYFGGPEVVGQPYYVYRITPTSSVASMSVELFDPMLVDVGDYCQRNLPREPDGLWALGDDPDKPNIYVDDARTRYAWGVTRDGTDADRGEVGPGAAASWSAQFCTGDRMLGEDPTTFGDDAERFVTTFALLAPNDSGNPLWSEVIPGCVAQYGGFSGDLAKALVDTEAQYNPTVAQNFRQWSQLCTVNSPEAGRDYYLLVRTNVASTDKVRNPLDDPATTGNGLNGYGVTVSGGAGSTVNIAAPERMSTYSAAASDGDAFFARVTPANSGNRLTISFTYASEVAYVPAEVQVKNPLDGKLVDPVDGTQSAMPTNPTGCEAAGDVSRSPTGDFDETSCTLSEVKSAHGYDGKIQRIEVPIPTGYVCDETDPSGCWYRLEFSHPAGVTSTWSAELAGDPVRLVR